MNFNTYVHVFSPLANNNLFVRDMIKVYFMCYTLPSVCKLHIWLLIAGYFQQNVPGYSFISINSSTIKKIYSW